MSKSNLINKIDSPPEYGSSIVLDIVDNPVSLTITLGNILQTKFSQFFQHKYDIGVVEWRMLFILAREPEITMSQITEIITMDKAAVSRALTKLNEKRLVTSTTVGTNSRSKYWNLTPAGVALHDVILNAVSANTQEVFSGISEESLSVTTEVIKRMKQNMQNIDWEKS